MDQYKISQTPGKGRKKPAKRKVKTPIRRDARSLDPQMVMVVVVLILVLVLGVVAGAYFFRKSPSNAGSGSNAASKGSSASGQVAGVPGPTFTDVTTAIGNKNAAGLKAYYAKRVRVVIIKSSLNQTLGAAQANGVIANPLNAAQTPWDWHVSPGALSAWQTGPYGQYFIGNVLVGIAADGTVISIHFDDNGQIDVVFVAPVGNLTTPATPGGTSTTTTGGGTTTTTPPVTTPPVVEPDKAD